MDEQSPYAEGYMLFKACGRCCGDMSYQTYIFAGSRTHDFTCLQCGNVVPLVKVQYDLMMAERIDSPLKLVP